MDIKLEPDDPSLERKKQPIFVNIPNKFSYSPEAQASIKQDDLSASNYCEVYIKPEVESNPETDSEWENCKENFYDNLFPLSNNEFGECSYSSKTEHKQQTTPQNKIHRSKKITEHYSTREKDECRRFINGSYPPKNSSSTEEISAVEKYIIEEILYSAKKACVSLIRMSFFKQNFFCNVCNVILNSFKSLKRHMSLHKYLVNLNQLTKRALVNSYDEIQSGLNAEDLTPFPCVICDLKFSTSFFLKRHTMCHSDGRPFQCGECSLRFKHINNLTQHKMIHNGEKPFKCHVCPFQCRKSSGLKRHAVNHTGDTPFQCEVCLLSFKKEIVLKRHKSTHNKERRYECDVCGLIFRKVSHLTSHKAIHTDVKLFRCDVCQSQFRRLSDLKRHTRVTHSEERAFSCDECNMKFKHSCNLKKHKAKHCISVSTAYNHVRIAKVSSVNS